MTAVTGPAPPGTWTRWGQPAWPLFATRKETGTMTSTTASTATAAAIVAPPPGTYRIDSQRSVVSFTTRHLFGLPVHGSLDLIRGEIRIAGPLPESSVRAALSAASFRTGNPARDASVRSARFLAASEHPAITFTSGRLDQSGGQWLVRGTLSVRGAASPVTVVVESARLAGPQLRIRASARVDRLSAGVTRARGLAGRYLAVRLEITAERG